MGTFKDYILEGAEDAKIIRKRLKLELGLSSKDVSVKTQSGGMSSAVNVTIKTRKALGKLSKIKEIGTDNEDYDTDATGEILGGGNTFIFVELDYKFREELSDKIQKDFEKLTGGEVGESDSYKLYGKIQINTISDGGVYVFLNHKSREIKQINYVGAEILRFIESLHDDDLFDILD